MKEAEWCACEAPSQMIAALGERTSTRKLSLFAVAGCYLCKPLARKPKEKFEVVVRFADGRADLKAIRKHWGRMRPGGTWPERPYHWAHQFATDCEDGADSENEYPLPIVVVPLLRDIFGNPFRPVTFTTDWRTNTVVTLARTMYDAREFSAMPILADALQDAGCDNDDILNHCRDTTATHVRGCWVVDLVLGKA